MGGVMISTEFLLAALIVVLMPGTGVVYTLGVALARGGGGLGRRGALRTPAAVRGRDGLDLPRLGSGLRCHGAAPGLVGALR
jgi:hypothetical protein